MNYRNFFLLVLLVIVFLGKTSGMPMATQPPMFGCGGMLNGSSGSFGTPGYPSSYDNNLACVWTLHIPIDGYLWLKFIVFHTEQCCDFVLLTDNGGQRIDRLSGFRPQYNVTVQGSRTQLLRIIFTSDTSVRRKGFLAQYHIVLPPPSSSVLSSSPLMSFTTEVTAIPTMSSPLSPILSSSPSQSTMVTTLPTLSSPSQSTMVTEIPTLSSPSQSTMATALPTFSPMPTSSPLQSTPVTGMPTFSSAPFTTFTLEPSSAFSTPVMSSSVTTGVTLPPDVQSVLLNILSSLIQIMRTLQTLLQGPNSPEALPKFQKEMLQIMQQIENQMVSPSPLIPTAPPGPPTAPPGPPPGPPTAPPDPTQPRNMQGRAKRAVRELPDPQELVKLLQEIQHKLLG